MKRMHERHSILGGAALAFGLLIASCIPTKKDEEVTGSGTELGNVIGSIYTADGRPAAGLTVTLYPEGGDSAGIKSAVTDAEGDYAFKGANGEYMLYTVDAAGNGLVVDSILTDIGTLVDLERRHLSPFAAIEGHAKVIGPRGAAKVEIYMSRFPIRFETNPNTDFRWQGLPPGRWWLGISYGWAKSIEIPITLAAGQTLDLDTVTLVNQYSAGISGRDTLKVSSSQLPLYFQDKLAGNGGMVDSVVWTLNGTKLPVQMDTTHMGLTLEQGSLEAEGYNDLVMHLYRKDTTVVRAWLIDLDDTPVRPWARHAVRAVFLSKEENPRPNTAGFKLGTFRILERRLVADAEMEFWGWTPVPGGDTALPSLINIPMFYFSQSIPERCGDVAYPMVTEFFPGDTLTFFTMPDAFSGARAIRITKDEDFADMGNGAWFAAADWPLGDYYDGKTKFTSRNLRFGETTLDIRLNRNHYASSGLQCTPFTRAFTLGADATPKEFVAMPAGMASGDLLLHYRTANAKGFYADSLASAGDYVYLDSTGKGVAGHDADRREVQLTAAEVTELKALLAPLPAVMPWEWDKDFLQDTDALPQTARYLLSGNRGSLLAETPHGSPEAKTALFQAVEAWLRDHNLL